MAAPPSSPVVLITGSSHGGIGYSLCETFAARGCTVYASARRLETISSFSHSSIRPLIMDVTSDASVHKAVEQIIEEAGRVDIVVANAGVPCHGPVLDVPIDQAKQALDTNVLGVLRLAQAVFPYMASRKRGTFITIGSVMGYNSSPWAGIYAATKAAAHAITETLQMEARALSPDIRVMLVVTGGVKQVLAPNHSTPTNLFRLPPIPTERYHPHPIIPNRTQHAYRRLRKRCCKCRIKKRRSAKSSGDWGAYAVVQDI
ncbi:unnamed protein product [Rhizoctonia solani]|uniref:NADPH-dependent 1-acyldihydroxyacetone phosphate reductase n=1 Tax=Rhizoctonia solani TaxID=456999 RepID=A0A8H3D2R7_9AGAM|nr:unnamed protein product [Rhizoctonia solani]